MRIDIISALPSIFNGIFDTSILHRGIKAGIVKIKIHDLRSYSDHKQNKIDDYSFGGGAGMVLKAEPIAKCIRELKSKRKYDKVIFMSPDGKLLNQKLSNKCLSCELHKTSLPTMATFEESVTPGGATNKTVRVL